MSAGFNRCQLLGNLGTDPELKYTQGGSAVLKMRIATTEVFFDRDRNKKERTDWHNVVVWGKRGEALSKILSKGSRVFVDGATRNDSYEGRDGQKKYRTEVHAREIILLGGRGEGGGHGNGGESQRDEPQQSDTQSRNYDDSSFNDDDIPF